MVNLLTNEVVDLIEGRDIKTVSEWLKMFPNLKIVSRDGSSSYKSAIKDANNNIIQVSDRFHEIKNLSETLENFIRRKYSKQIIVVQGNNDDTNKEDDFINEYKLLSPSTKENYDRKNKEFQQIKEYYNRCDNYSKTAKMFGIDARTVKEYIHMDNLPISKRKSFSKIDKYRDIIIDNIDKKQFDIYEIIKRKGYKGTYSNLRNYIKRKQLKISTLDKNKYVNRTSIIDILHHNSISDLILNKDEEKLLKMLLKQDKLLSKVIELSANFYITIFSQNSSKLDEWIKEAKILNIKELNTFISSLVSDIKASKNSIDYLKISNGVIEGKNCKLKLIKRIMYGRCSYGLLRAKLLQLC